MNQHLPSLVGLPGELLTQIAEEVFLRDPSSILTITPDGALVTHALLCTCPELRHDLLQLFLDCAPGQAGFIVVLVRYFDLEAVLDTTITMAGLVERLAYPQHGRCTVIVEFHLDHDWKNGARHPNIRAKWKALEDISQVNDMVRCRPVVVADRDVELDRVYTYLECRSSRAGTWTMAHAARIARRRKHGA